MIQARITKIDSKKNSRNHEQTFVRVYFRIMTPQGNPSKLWAKTDLVDTFRNFTRWRPLLKVDNLLGGLRLKDGHSDTVDADSEVYLIKAAPMSVEQEAKQGQLL